MLPPQPKMFIFKFIMFKLKHWECKLLMGLYRYSESSNHVMIFCEALYLNSLVSFSTFSESNNYKYFILTGWSKKFLFLKAK